MAGQSPYNFSENTLGSIASNVGKQLQKAAKHVGKRESEKVKAEAIAQEEAAVARSLKSAKAAVARKKNAAPKPGRMSGSKGIDTRPSGLPPIKPVVLNRQQHFESAVGNAKDTSTTPMPVAKNTTMTSVDPSTAYND